MTFYTNRLIPSGSAGATRGPFIFIRPQYKDDKGLLEHEKVHRKQWLCTLGLHSFLYLLSKRYKLWAEVQAYKEQLRWPPASGREEYMKCYAGFISKNYRLDVSVEEAEERLRN